MVPERLEGRVGPMPKQPFSQAPKQDIKIGAAPSGSGQVYHEAGNAIEQFLKKPQTVRHPLGRGVPQDSPLLGGQ